GCANDAPQDIMQPEGPDARTINNLQMPIFMIAGAVGLIVAAAVIVIVVKFRARPDKSDEVPRQVHGAPRLEIAWTLAPAVLLAAIAVPTLKTVFDLAERPENAMTVNVVGQQWWWEFQYPELGITTANELVVPVDKPVQLRITSRDVIHSFWIPKLNGKKDAVPNRIHDLRMTAEKPGEYWGQCTEFCGLSHANMRQRVVALSQTDFDAWTKNMQAAAAKPTDEAALRGEALFVGQCVRCHTVDGLKDDQGKAIVGQPDEQLVAGAAPNLTHLMSRTTFAGGAFDLKQPECTNDAQYSATYKTGTAEGCLNRAELERWLRNAPAMKPMYTKPAEATNGLIRGMPNLGLSESQIDDLVAYLVTLK
ncbi:MAG TPA: cytochrome c oxidase subunit II, partial [Acidimicrobiales bacterium]